MSTLRWPLQRAVRRALSITPVVISMACAGNSNVGRATSAQRLSFIQSDSTVAKREAGPHNGGGTTTAYPFFANEPGLALIFRKRALHPGSAIGYHRNDVDEIYYVLSGHGELVLNGERQVVGPGTAILTRAGSSHGLKQLGSDDLVILINYLHATAE
ncbi:MAG: cupin domain-containing protein [Gemmatimonadaceae bacterium]